MKPLTRSQEIVMRELVKQVAEKEHELVDLRSRAALIGVGLNPDGEGLLVDVPVPTSCATGAEKQQEKGNG